MSLSLTLINKIINFILIISFDFEINLVENCMYYKFSGSKSSDTHITKEDILFSALQVTLKFIKYKRFHNLLRI